LAAVPAPPRSFSPPPRAAGIGAAAAPRPAVAGAALACVVVAALACSEKRESRFPERDYSGEYATVVARAENDCRSQGFARGDSLTVIVHHALDNRATVVIPPIATLQGAFGGDRLVARAAVAPPPLPPAPAEAPGAANGEPQPAAGDSIRYVLELGFEGDRFEGEYRIEQPAIPGWLDACSQRFGLRGEKAGSTPAPIEIPVGGP
jgi:hypothetical protein